MGGKMIIIKNKRVESLLLKFKIITHPICIHTMNDILRPDFHLKNKKY